MAKVEIVVNNVNLAKQELKGLVDVAMEACGLQAERYAKMSCPVDTGLLRNSITHSLGGGTLKGNYHAEYGENTYTDKAGKKRRYSARSKKAGSVKVGSVNATVGHRGDHSVYIGTNVYYAPYVEMGHITPSGKHTPAKPFLRPALEQHGKVYTGIIKKVLKGANESTNE